jgi:hypothetical protein
MLGLILSSLGMIGAWVGSHAIPGKNAFGTEEMVFSRGGYEFAA